ncbi:MAG: hypothetical protein OEQ13_11635, partial [Acidobacteriota bacterium]|nr:hypothetical protein [Acidobacteriota bacterium]
MGTADRVLRVVLGAGTIAVVLLLAIHRSDDAAVMGRYSLSYFATVLCLLPAVAAALGLALRGGRTLAAIAAAAAEPRLYLVFGLLWTPLALAAAYWSREESGVLRLLALCGLGIAPVLRAVWVAGSRGRTGVRAFASRAAVSVAAFYAVVLLFSPMLGRRVELEIGKSGITTIDVVSRRDVSGLSELGQKPDADFMYPGQPGRVREFSVRVRNNSWGFHDRERSFENPEGRTRLVVLGDNYVRGLEVPREAGLAAVLEQRLNARADRYEVVPLARNGIGQQG